MFLKSLYRKNENSVNSSKKAIQISLDVHEESTRIYCVDMRSGEILKDANILGHFKNVYKHIHRLGTPENTLILYEAGCHGFSPYRFFARKGYETKVIAPSSIPKCAREQKTDRDDAIRNMYYHKANLLRYVTVPSENDEDARECLRFRYHVMWTLTQEKQKIQSLVKRWGKKFVATKTYWTKAHYHWLRTIELGEGARMVLDCRLAKLDEIAKQLTELDRVLDTFMSSNSHYSYLMNAYQMFTGIGRLAAMTLILEGRDLSRFAHPKALMKYTGLIPGKRASGPRDPSLHITKAGNKYLRTALIGAAKYYGDSRIIFRQKQEKKLPREINDFNEKYKMRLHARYIALKKKGKHTNLVRAAIARELCGFIWSFINELLPQANGIEFSTAA